MTAILVVVFAVVSMTVAVIVTEIILRDDEKK